MSSPGCLLGISCPIMTGAPTTAGEGSTGNRNVSNTPWLDIGDMNKTIRNLDNEAYEALKARPALTGKTMGEMVSEAIRCYLAQPDALPKQGSLRALRPERYPKENEHLSEEIDAIQYGI
jgi:hypothetical protein